MSKTQCLPSGILTIPQEGQTCKHNTEQCANCTRCMEQSPEEVVPKLPGMYLEYRARKGVREEISQMSYLPVQTLLVCNMQGKK